MRPLLPQIEFFLFFMSSRCFSQIRWNYTIVRQKEGEEKKMSNAISESLIMSSFYANWDNNLTYDQILVI